MSEAKRILVTGAAGFIGSHTVSLLLEQGQEVHGLDNLNAYYDVSLKRARLARLQESPAFSFTLLDLVEHDAVLDLFRRTRPQIVIHLAAQAGVRYSLENPRAYTASNIDGFLSVLEGCRRTGVEHLIYASSSSVYGANSKLPFSETDPVAQPISLYAATKRANELMAHTYAHLYGIPSTGLRFFTVYGPWGRPDMAYFSFTKAILEGRPISVFNNGEMRRDFTYIDDVTAAMARLVQKSPTWGRESGPSGGGAPHRVYNLGNHTPVELKRFIRVIEEALGREAALRMLPMQPGDVPATYADVSGLEAAIGFAPSTPIEDGIRRFVEWYCAYYRVEK